MIVDSNEGVTLAGGAPFSARELTRSRRFAPCIVGVDGGADRLLQLGAEPEAVIGDLDSLSHEGRTRLAGRLFPIEEQVTTDFDKALRSVRAPFCLGIGFVGARADHGLAVFNALVRHPDKRCLILSGSDVIFLAPRAVQLRLPIGMRLSLFPMAPVQGRSSGLRWPIDGLTFAPGGMIGTSNEVTGPAVQLEFDADAMLVILPVTALKAVLTGLGLHKAARAR